MKRFNWFIFLFALYFTCPGVLMAQNKGKSYYIIDINEKALNTYDKHLLDSLLPIYHKSASDSVKLKVLKYFASVLSDEKIWVPYNNYLYSKTVGKSDTLSLLYYADALNNKGYESQYLKNNLDSAIVFYYKAVEINKKINYYAGLGTGLNNLAYIYQHQGNINKAIELYSEANTVFLKYNYYPGLASIGINLGDIYFNNDDFKNAEECFNNALVYAQKAKMDNVLGNVYAQLGAVAKHNNNKNRALHYYNKAIQIYRSQSNFDRLALTYMESSKAYGGLMDRELSGAMLDSALKYLGGTSDFDRKSMIYDYAAHYWMESKNYGLAKTYIDSAYKYAKLVGYPVLIYHAALKMSEYFNYKKQYEQAYNYLNEARAMNDSINNDNIKKSILKQQLKSDFEKKELEQKALQDKKDAEIIAEKKRQRYILFAVILALLATLVVVYVVYRNYASKKKAAILLEEKNKIIYHQKQEVEEKQKEIIDSINYAQKIQSAVLTSDEVWKKISPEYFILFQPKDIVSGDFYWAYNTLNNRSVFALADCTGHGVPGGFMSMLGNSFLNELVVENKLFKADVILNKLREKIIKALGQKGAEDRKDGMDMALCVWNKLENTLEFSGANNSLWLIRSGELIVYQGDKMPIGQFSEDLKPFSSHSVQLQKNDLVVLCTDGFADQFGGDGGKKLKSKNLKAFLVKNANHPLQKQKEDLATLFSNWKGAFEQVDDVSLIMIKAV